MLKSQAQEHTLATPVLEKQKRVDPWGSLVNQAVPLGKSNVVRDSVSIELTDVALVTTPGLPSSLLYTLTYICTLMHSDTCGHTHTQIREI